MSYEECPCCGGLPEPVIDYDKRKDLEIEILKKEAEILKIQRTTEAARLDEAMRQLKKHRGYKVTKEWLDELITERGDDE